ncbi:MULTISPECIES: NAD(P)H-dependent oxidoreductase [unclassified Clostridium]|uniref:FMN-dependent NADH-azoreductase n=1 Tax=unclassified Clostridium TaxID=2614128 RepID=UPI00189C482A|nr:MULTISPECIES: NAD(P)H-dependent oxidoreductase [unclassified Clostridium]MCR1952485.1 NAD(P)H-dependent oxidoreductase [Clostridium sp. DSM 100503]
MNKVLYIKANIKPEGQSRTFRISDNFIEEYKKNNPNDEVTVLDLYKEGIDFLRPEDLAAVFGEKTEESKKHPILKYAYQIAEADKIVISTPMWNLGTPAIVKAYFDYVSVTGITFKYTENGPVGLCKATKALIVSGRGGDYSNPITKDLEMGERYLKSILTFFGVKDIKSVAAENLDVYGIDVEKIVTDEIAEAKEIAKNF